MEKKAKVISGFPGVGKSQMFREYKDKVILDSDSSDFSWMKDNDGNNTKERNPEFPKNYMNHIKENIDKADIIFVSSHDVVRRALEDADIPYYLVYPSKEYKQAYIQRYINRGNNEGFINFISSNWDNFIDDIENEVYPKLIRLADETQFLSDIFKLPYCPIHRELCNSKTTMCSKCKRDLFSITL